MPSGMTFAEREAQRERYRLRALAEAAVTGLTLRCRYATESALGPEYHEGCLGESPGGAGCLCRCHDNPGAVVVARKDEVPGG